MSARTSDLEMEKILHKLLELVQQDIKLGCAHCEKILSGVLEEKEVKE